MTNRKVIFVATLFPHLAVFHIPFMRLLQAKGYEVHAAASSVEGRRADVEAAEVICWEIPFARSPYSLSNLRAFWQLKALLKEHRFDLIHVHTPVAALMTRYLAKVTGQGPVLYTVHGFHFYRGAPWKDWLIYRTAERIAARWTDGMIVMNAEDYDHAKGMGFLPGANLFCISGVGMDLSNHPPLSGKGGIRATLGFAVDAVLIACVAELNANKNHSFLLEAWKRIAPKYAGAHLLLVGSGEQEVALQRKVERERIERVHFLGYRRDVPQIMQEVNILALVSKREGLPKSIMEAMAAGKPVVVTNIRGCRDLVDDDSTGFLVELGDVTALAMAIERLISDGALCATMGAAGREKIENYSLEKMLAAMSETYDFFLAPGTEPIASSTDSASQI